MSKTALVVDDSASLRAVLRITLEQAGYQVLEAGDGVEALKVLDGRTLDCVICDVAMPRMDGPAFLRQLRSREAYRRTPVVVVTTQSSLAVREECRRAGAGAWIPKPFQPKMLLDTIARLVKGAGALA
jgi:two-component system chemotaxis response regulator CheY